MKNKELYLIGGSNGAGKTTFAREFLPRYIDCPRFINPDLIAAGLSPFDPDAVAARAGRMVLEEIQNAIAAGQRFAFESTLSGRVYSRILRTAKEHGYQIHLFYLWVPDPLLALARIRDRVDSGGHNVPEADVRRRYGRTLHNFSTSIGRPPTQFTFSTIPVTSRSWFLKMRTASQRFITNGCMTNCFQYGDHYEHKPFAGFK